MHWPESLRPQHATVPSVLRPQAWAAPALIWVKEPAGGLVTLTKLGPQHVTVRSVLIPHV